MVADRAAQPWRRARPGRARPRRPPAAAALVAAIELERAAALERDFIAFADRANRGAPGGPAECAFEYLLVVATRAGG